MISIFSVTYCFVLFCFLIHSSDYVRGSFLYRLSSIASQYSNAQTYMSESSTCDYLPGLTYEQRRLCRREPAILQSVILGTQMGLRECERQFRWEKWNCSTRMITFIKTIERAYRETAFVYAITSAGVMHSVTRACSAGNLTLCSCGDTIPPPDADKYMVDTSEPISSPRFNISDRKENKPIPIFKWAGCSDNVEFGLRFGHYFVDRSEDEDEMKLEANLRAAERELGTRKGQSPLQMKKLRRQYRRERIRRRINRHNNLVGRQLIAQNLQVACRCHGVSGSCSLKSCWRVMPHFAQVGVMLKSRYQDAQKLRRKWRKELLEAQSNDEEKRTGGLEARDPSHSQRRSFDLSKENRGDGVNYNTLLYIHRSPNFCSADPDQGVLGTVGRQCHKNSGGNDDCYVICCGRGFETREVRKVTQCNCKFVWCCHVVCEECVNYEKEYYCH